MYDYMEWYILYEWMWWCDDNSIVTNYYSDQDCQDETDWESSWDSIWTTSTSTYTCEGGHDECTDECWYFSSIDCDSDSHDSDDMPSSTDVGGGDGASM